MAGDKTIKISIAVVDADVAKAKRAISEITEQVRELVKLSGGIGGFAGGGGGARVSGIAGMSGTSAATQARHAAAGGGGKLDLTAGLSQGASAAANVIKGATESSKKSFKEMKGQFKDLVDAQERDVRRLESTWTRFKRSMGFGKTAGEVAGGGGGGGGKEKSEGGGFFKNVAQQLGVPGWALGAAGIGGGIIGAGLYGLSAYGQQKGAQLQYNLNSPLYGAAMAAREGGIFGGNTLGIRGGDVARSWAISQVRNTPEYQHVVANSYKELIKEQVRRDAPLTFGEAARTGDVSKLWDVQKSRIGGVIADFQQHPLGATWRAAKRVFSFGFAGNDLPDDVMTTAQQARNTANFQHSADQAQARQTLIESYMHAHPIFGSQLNEFYGGAIGGLEASRAAGISGKFYRRRDGTYADTLSDFEAAANRRGTTGANIAGMRQRLGATAGQGFFYQGGTLLSPEAGGLGNAANLIGVGAQFGGNLFGAVQGMIGQRGRTTGRTSLDIAAGQQISDIGMAGMQSGNFQGTSGMGLMGTLGEVGFTGSTGGDMRMARMTAGGMVANDRMMAGQIDPLQNALNFSAAMKVASNLPWSTKAALTKLDTASAMDIVRTGKVPVDLAVRGVTADMVKKYLAAQDQTAFARVSTKMLSTEQRSALAAYRAGGIKGAIGGLKGDARERAMHALSSTLTLGTGDTPEAAYMRIRFQAARAGLLETPHGKGATRSDSMKSNRGQGAKTHGRFTALTGEELAEAEHKGKNVSGAIGSMVPNQGEEAAAGAAAAAAVGGGDLNHTIDQLGSILKVFVKQLHGVVDGGTSGPPRTGP
jgi:hypothetical protein